MTRIWPGGRFRWATGGARRAARRAVPLGRGGGAADLRVVPVRPLVEAARGAGAADGGRGGGLRGGRTAAARRGRGRGRGGRLGISGAARGGGVPGVRPVVRADGRVDEGRGHGAGRPTAAAGAAVRLGDGERTRSARADGGDGERGGGAVPGCAAEVLGGRDGSGAVGDDGLDGGVPCGARAAGDAVAGGGWVPGGGGAAPRYPMPPGTRPNMPRQRPPESPR